MESVVYTYAGGKPMEKATLDGAQKPLSSRRYTYSASGLESETLLDARGSQQTRSLYGYDAAGLLSVWLIYDGKDTLVGRVVYRYAGGRLTETEVQGPSGAAEGYTVFEYDAAGNVVAERTLSDSRALERSVERSYRGRVLVEERTMQAGGAPDRVIAYETDELGNPVRITTRDGKGRLISVQSLDYRYIER